MLIVDINTKTSFSMQKFAFVALYTSQPPTNLSSLSCSYYSKKSSEEKSANSF